MDLIAVPENIKMPLYSETSRLTDYYLPCFFHSQLSIVVNKKILDCTFKLCIDIINLRRETDYHLVKKKKDHDVQQI